MPAILLICVAIVLILFSCELFVNSVEWLGRTLHLSESAVGNVLAAAGTALPESLVTLFAVAFSGGSAVNQEIGIGAIIGGPLMLSTVAYFSVGLAVLLTRKRRAAGTSFNLNQRAVSRDVLWFLCIFGAAVGVSLVPYKPLHILTALGMLIAYVAYVSGQIGAESGAQRALAPLHFHRASLPPDTWRVVLQVVVAVAGMSLGAHVFVENLSEIALGVGLPVVVLSLLLSPIATELPEVMNAVIWVRQGKEDLSIGNVSGSMLVQAAIPCSLGMIFTEWQLSLEPALAVLAILASALFVFFNLRSEKLTPKRLLFHGLPYLALLVFFLTKQ